MTAEETSKYYELNTGNVIVERFAGMAAMQMYGVLVHGQAPFTQCTDPSEALHNAIVLEEVTKMAFRTEMLGNKKLVIQHLLDRHFMRKHGEEAYYGQDKG